MLHFRKTSYIILQSPSLNDDQRFDHYNSEGPRLHSLLPGASARGLLGLVWRWYEDVAILDLIFSQNSFNSDASERLTLPP
jgi:hypothetical protein